MYLCKNEMIINILFIGEETIENYFATDIICNIEKKLLKILHEEDQIHLTKSRLFKNEIWIYLFYKKLYTCI